MVINGVSSLVCSHLLFVTAGLVTYCDGFVTSSARHQIILGTGQPTRTANHDFYLTSKDAVSASVLLILCYDLPAPLKGIIVGGDGEDFVLVKFFQVQKQKHCCWTPISNTAPTFIHKQKQKQKQNTTTSTLVAIK